MGAHLINNEFQSDKYPECPRGKVPLSVKDKSAQDLLWEYAQRRREVDAEFSEDLETALRLAGFMPPEPIRSGATNIANERARQIQSEHYDEVDDDECNQHELAWAAICYAAPEPVYRRYSTGSYDDPWPWDAEDDKRQYSGEALRKPTEAQYLRRLVKAGALIAAEIDRLLRRRWSKRKSKIT